MNCTAWRAPAIITVGIRSDALLVIHSVRADSPDPIGSGSALAPAAWRSSRRIWLFGSVPDGRLQAGIGAIIEEARHHLPRLFHFSDVDFGGDDARSVLFPFC
jgi:hypothetical protein